MSVYNILLETQQVIKALKGSLDLPPKIYFEISLESRHHVLIQFNGIENPLE